MRILASTSVALLLLPLLAGGCTAGQIVDADFKPIQIGTGGTVELIGVDPASGRWTGDVYRFASLSGPNTDTLNSPIFHHEYYTTCTDHFTGAADASCAIYWFQATFCAVEPCVATATTRSGFRVLPMFNRPFGELSTGPGPGGTLQGSC